MRICTIPATVKAFRQYDPRSAYNKTMLLRLLDEHAVSYDRGGGRIVVDMDAVIGMIDRTLGLTALDMPHLRSIRKAYAERRADAPESGISEAYLRACVKDGRIPSLRIGNRCYIAMESLQAEQIEKIIEHGDSRPRAAARNQTDLMEQLDAILKNQSGTPLVRRVRRTVL